MFALCELLGMEPLTKYREASGLSKKALAEKLGTSAGYVSDLINGRRRPSPAFANQIERLTGISRKELLPEIFGEPSDEPTSSKQEGAAA